MISKKREYQGDGITVSYEAKRCIHAAECVRGLPAVFDTDKRPWIQPKESSPDKLAAVILRCPSGALHFVRTDGGRAEAIPEANTILPAVHGPVYIQGNVRITTPDGETLQDTRVALCRCGASDNKPFCDNSHLKIDFQAADRSTYPQGEAHEMEASGPLEITPLTGGPYLLQGNFEIRNADGQSLFHGHKTALCRCGASQNKPFCDGSHRSIGFATRTSAQEQMND